MECIQHSFGRSVAGLKPRNHMSQLLGLLLAKLRELSKDSADFADFASVKSRPLAQPGV